MSEYLPILEESFLSLFLRRKKETIGKSNYKNTSEYPLIFMKNVQIEIRPERRKIRPVRKFANPSENSAIPSGNSVYPSENSANPSENSANPSENSVYPSEIWPPPFLAMDSGEFFSTKQGDPSSVCII